MKILIATGLYPPDIGGPATYTVLLEAELPRHGVTVTVLPFSTVTRYPKIVRHVLFFFKILRVARQVDVVYALDPVSVGLPAYVASVVLRKPFLIRLGGDYAWEQYRLRYGGDMTLEEFWEEKSAKILPPFILLLRTIQSYVTKRASGVIAPSNYLKNIITKWGVKGEHISVIYSVLKPVSVNQDRDFLRTKRNMSYPTITTAGRAVPWKGFRELLFVIADIKKTYPHIQLCIAGDGDQVAMLQATIDTLGIQSHVQLLGRLSREELAEVIYASDVFVLNTGYEGLSHQLVEVMSQGVPIVTTAVGGNGELIQHQENGMLVEYNNIEQLSAAIKTVLDNPAQTTSMTKRAKKTVDNFSKEQMIKQLVAVIQAYE